ncbi:MAG: DUF1990 domain-containing protein [Terracidiphilus sp.]
MTKPTTEEMGRLVETASRVLLKPDYLNVEGRLLTGQALSGFEIDQMRTQIGTGKQAFENAIRGFESWMQFDLGWVRIANPTTRIEVGAIAAVGVRSLGLWSLNLSQLVETVRTGTHFGFVYKTTPNHVEDGEERFVLTYESSTGGVWYETEAVSRPRDVLALFGYPVTRAFQHRFARDSHRRMREVSSMSS